MIPLQDKSIVDARWDSRKLKAEDSIVWRAGNTSIWVLKTELDWMLAGNTDKEEAERFIFEKAISLPIDVEWKRWAGLGALSTVRFQPAFPDRPLVVKTRAPVMVSPEQSIDLYINIPVWVEVSLDTDVGSTTLGVFPTRTLSNTWFGTQYEGELCYALKSLARRLKDDLTIEALAATCRFTITNRFDEPLPLDRIRVLPRHLSIYKSRRRLWTSPIKVISNGPDQPSQLEYPEEPHTDAHSVVELVRPPEEVYRPSFFRESFAHYTRALFE
jgi:hypothetical protein